MDYQEFAAEHRADRTDGGKPKRKRILSRPDVGATKPRRLVADAIGPTSPTGLVIGLPVRKPGYGA